MFCHIYSVHRHPELHGQLLGLLSIGFIQGLYALDAADGHTDHPVQVVNLLIQALLQYVHDQISGLLRAHGILPRQSAELR